MSAKSESRSFSRSRTSLAFCLSVQRSFCVHVSIWRVSICDVPTHDALPALLEDGVGRLVRLRIGFCARAVVVDFLGKVRRDWRKHGREGPQRLTKGRASQPLMASPSLKSALTWSSTAMHARRLGLLSASEYSTSLMAVK